MQRLLCKGFFAEKSLHTRQGAGRALLDGLLAEARRRGFRRVSLETGTQEGFAAARRLYRGAGLAACPPFGDYRATPDNVYFTREL
ncbi:GNAT family N-acetyltransferase [Streptomyces sp. NBC_00433]